MLKREKERIVSELAERLRAAETLIVTDYRGLSVGQLEEVRTKLLAHGVRYRIVKNSLTRLAAEEAGADELLELIDGPTAIAFLEGDADPAAAAKVLNETASTGRVLVVRGGIFEGKRISDADLEKLASLPPTDVLRAQLAGALAAPLGTILGLFSAPLRDFVNVIDARIKQLSAEGEPPAAAEAAQEGPAEGGEPASAEDNDTSLQPPAGDKED